MMNEYACLDGACGEHTLQQERRVEVSGQLRVVVRLEAGVRAVLHASAPSARAAQPASRRRRARRRRCRRRRLGGQLLVQYTIPI